MSTQTQGMKRALEVADRQSTRARDEVMQAAQTPVSEALLALIVAVDQLQVAVDHARAWMARFEDMDDQQELAMESQRAIRAFAQGGRFGHVD